MFTVDESFTVKSLNKRVIASSSTVNNGRFSCFLFRSFLHCSVWKLTIMVFKWKDDQTPLVLDFMRSRECPWNTRSEDCRKNTLWNCTTENCGGAEFSELTVENVRCRQKRFFFFYSAELVKVVKSEKRSLAGLHGSYVPKLYSNKHIHSCLALVFHELQLQQSFFFK